MANRTDRTIESDHSFAPVTWTLDQDRVKFIWRETIAVFGDGTWMQSVRGDKGIPHEWQDEIARRGGSEFSDVIFEAVGRLTRDHDPGLVLLALRDTFGRYNVILDIEPHPWHGDVIARALDLRAAGRTRPEYAPVTWWFDEDRVVRMWDHVRWSSPDDIMCELSEQELDELALRRGLGIGVLMSVATDHLKTSVDPSVAFLAVHDYFHGPDNGDVAFEFAPHPEHGDVLPRARQINDAMLRAARRYYKRL
jgi:hypothetical protein